MKKRGIKLSKKGMTANFLVSIIITLVAFLLLSATIVKFMSGQDEKGKENACHTSIALRAQTVFNLNPEKNNDKFDLIKAKIKVIPPVCETIDKEVKGKREKVKQVVADKIARCWWMFGEGRYEETLHGSSIQLLPDIFGFEELENKCFNCYTILVDKEAMKNEPPISGEEMIDYLNTKKHPQVKDKTYLEYIQSYGGPGRVVFSAPYIIPGEAYSISMMPKLKDIDEESAFWEGVGKIAIGTTVVLGVALGTVCIVSTAGLCTAVVGPLAAVATTGTLAGLGIIAIGAKATVLIAGGAAYMAYSGYMDVMSSLYKEERYISSVYFGFLEVGQQMCGSGDIRGQ